MSFVANDTIILQGTGLDGDGAVLPDAAFQWIVEFRHDDHLHPYARFDGPEALLQVKTVGHSFEGVTGFYVRLTVTGSNGLTTTESVYVSPAKVRRGEARNLDYHRPDSNHVCLKVSPCRCECLVCYPIEAITLPSP